MVTLQRPTWYQWRKYGRVEHRETPSNLKMYFGTHCTFYSAQCHSHNMLLTAAINCYNIIIANYGTTHATDVLVDKYLKAFEF